jgi:hypothetical protein
MGEILAKRRVCAQPSPGSDYIRPRELVPWRGALDAALGMFFSHVANAVGGDESGDSVRATWQVVINSKSPSVVFNYPDLLKCPVDGLAWAVSERPQEAIPCLGIAVFEALFVDRYASCSLLTTHHLR